MRTLAIVLSALVLSAAASTGAAADDAKPTFTGIVTQVSTTNITVADAASKQTLRFLIVPTYGYGVVLADGNPTVQMAAIAVGWDLKITYSRNAAGLLHADHVVKLR
jgi:hypothetical protein